MRMDGSTADRIGRCGLPRGVFEREGSEMETTHEERIVSPWSGEWPRDEDGIQVINVADLQRTWNLRTGRVNIALNWAHFGDVLDVEWLRANHGRLEDDVAISLWMDFVSFHGDDDLTAQAEVLTPRIAALWEEGEPAVTPGGGGDGEVGEA